MPPGVTRDQEAFDPDAVNIQHVTVLEQHLFVADGHLRQLVEVIDHLAAHLAGQVAVFRLADIQDRIAEQPRAVGLHRADMVGILMGDEDLPDAFRIDAEPAHLLFETIIVVSGVKHEGGIALAVEEDIRHPLAHAGHMLVDPARLQRLEDLLAPVHFAHFFFLKFRRFSGHLHVLLFF